MTISKKRLKKIASIKESKISYSDIPELTSSFWKSAKIIQPTKKTAISLRLDSEILSWFKKQGKGYQSLINSVLKTYVQAKQAK